MPKPKQNQNKLVKAIAIEIGDIVYVKMRGYAIWPAKVTKTDIKIDVKFYGDNSVASVSRQSVFSFSKEVDVTRHMNTKGYEKAIKEALIELASRSNANETRKRKSKPKIEAAKVKIASRSNSKETKKTESKKPKIESAKKQIQKIVTFDVRIYRGHILVKSNENGRICGRQEMLSNNEILRTAPIILNVV